jgi:hypothetical protein
MSSLSVAIPTKMSAIPFEYQDYVWNASKLDSLHVFCKYSNSRYDLRGHYTVYQAHHSTCQSNNDIQSPPSLRNYAG